MGPFGNDRVPAAAKGLLYDAEKKDTLVVIL